MSAERTARLAFALLLSLPSVSFADEPKECPAVCHGFFYKAKRASVPIYRERDATSEVIAKLTLGERVCGVGEEREFVILQWRGAEGGPESTAGLAFAKRTDLWEPERDSGREGEISPVDQVRRFYNRLRSGVVPDDALTPYGPLIDSFRHGNESPAGCTPKKEP